MLRLGSDLAEICLAVAEGRLADTPVAWNDKCAVGVVVVSSTYPAAYETGFPIIGDLPVEDNAIVFHAGTSENEEDQLVTAGGRVLVATASSMIRSRSPYKGFEIAKGIEFEGARYRSDIAVGAD